MIGAFEFIHQTSIGNLEEARAAQKAFKSIMLDLDEKGLLDGYRLSVVKNEEDFEYHVLPGSVKDITNKRYPYLYLSLQPYQHASTEDLETILSVVSDEFVSFDYFNGMV